MFVGCGRLLVYLWYCCLGGRFRESIRRFLVLGRKGGIRGGLRRVGRRRIRRFSFRVYTVFLVLGFVLVVFVSWGRCFGFRG